MRKARMARCNTAVRIQAATRMTVMRSAAVVAPPMPAHRLVEGVEDGLV